jgi:hypothetical protein
MKLCIRDVCRESAYSDGQQVSVLIHTLKELATKELNTHDGEDEPEDETHEEHIEDGGDSIHECVHNYLKYRAHCGHTGSHVPHFQNTVSEFLLAENRNHIRLDS